MLISELPLELLSLILSYLPRERLFECLKVCKTWHKKAMPIYYSVLTLDQNHVQVLESCKTAMEPDGSHFGDFVKTLIITCNCRNASKHMLEQEQFGALISALPSLQVIHINCHPDYRMAITYLGYLGKYVYYTKLQEITIPSLSSFVIPIRKIVMLHYSVNLQIRHQITTLVLDVTLDRLGSDNILCYLAGFISLEHLVLGNVKRVNNDDMGVHLDSVLNTCHNLKSLKYVNDFPLDLSQNNHTYHYNLTSLSLELPQCSKDYFLYIMEHTPNLKHLSISMSSSSLLDIYNSFESDMAARFLTYLKQLQQLHVKGASVNRTPGAVIFWHMIREIYDGTSCGSLKLCVRERWKQVEVIHFDRRLKTFNISYQWRLLDWRADLLINPFHFLKLYYIHIDDNVSTFNSGIGEYKYHAIPEILNAVLLNERVSLYIRTPEQEIALCNRIERINILEHKTYRLITYPDVHCSIVQNAYFHAGQLTNIVLEKISAIYPSIQKFTFAKCTLPLYFTNNYTIELHRFNDVNEIMFDCDIILGRQRQKQALYIHTTHDDKYYYYNDKAIKQVVHTIQDLKKIPKSGNVVEINCNSLKTFVFRRNSIKLEIKY